MKIPTIFNISEITTIAVSIVILVRNGYRNTPYLVVALATLCLAAYVAPYVKPLNRALLHNLDFAHDLLAQPAFVEVCGTSDRKLQSEAKNASLSAACRAARYLRRLGSMG